jgi:hypothetical protein
VIKSSKNGKLTRSVKICPNRVQVIKKTIDYIILTSFIGNQCQTSIDVKVNKLIKSGVSIEQILKKFGNFSKEFVQKLASSLANKITRIKGGINKNELGKLVNKSGRSNSKVFIN